MKKFIIAALMALPMSLFAQKVAHVNVNDIITAMPEYTAAQTEMQTTSKQYEDEFKRMQDELQTKYEDYQKNAQTLPEAVRTRRETELQDLQTRMQQYAQTSQEELQRLEQQKMAAIQEKMQKAISEVGAAGGYTYIYNAATLLYVGTTATDITAQVKTKLGIK